ncbi:MAG: acetate--CoA ligase [Calditrichaeota bacterium]|nr:acetate--CoA ligase [Calditrichota bacterium]
MLVKEDWSNRSLNKKSDYDMKYPSSLKLNGDDFWSEQSKRIDWMKPFKKVSQWSFQKPVDIKWFIDGKLNVSFNCVDRHAQKTPDKTAFYWEPDNPKESNQEITYRQLQENVNKCANALKSLGVKKGDRITIYLPMIPEAIYSMLACARIGAIHSVVFAGFSPDSLANRIIDGGCEFVITADGGYRGGKILNLKDAVDKALEKCPVVKNVLVVRRTQQDVNWNSNRDIWYHDVTKDKSIACTPEEIDSEDPLFILYTSGSTGKPKGVLHTSGGYLTYASYTHKNVFDYHDGDIYWCAADVGWITGHSYIVYGPLANGATSVFFEGVPTWPTASRIWEIVDKYQVNILYTAPTLLRSLMREGDELLNSTSRTSLRTLGSVGEPINPEAWKWYYEKVGKENCPIVDTWWQTETGGIMITPLPGAVDLKPGSASKPFYGIEPVILDQEGRELQGPCEGVLCMKRSWPGQMRSLYGDHSRFEDTYFSQYPGYYFAGDGCHRDKDDYYWIIGRVDDVINVSGHRMGTAEIESSLVAHPKVAEAAVVGFPHDIKGQGIYAFVTLMNHISPSVELNNELIQWVRNDIGAIAKPDIIQFSPALPKTRSGKIMRRILRKLAEGSTDSFGDVTTLADPSIVDQMILERQKIGTV